jgi:hypothetical protein
LGTFIGPSHEGDHDHGCSALARVLVRNEDSKKLFVEIKEAYVLLLEDTLDKSADSVSLLKPSLSDTRADVVQTATACKESMLEKQAKIGTLNQLDVAQRDDCAHTAQECEEAKRENENLVKCLEIQKNKADFWRQLGVLR